MANIRTNTLSECRVVEYCAFPGWKVNGTKESYLGGLESVVVVRHRENMNREVRFMPIVFGGLLKSRPRGGAVRGHQIYEYIHLGVGLKFITVHTVVVVVVLTWFLSS